MDKVLINGTYIKQECSSRHAEDDRADEIFFRCPFCKSKVERQYGWLVRGHSIQCFECLAFFEVEDISQLNNTVTLSIDRARTPVGRLLERYSNQIRLAI